MSHRIAYNCKGDSALVGFPTEAGQAAWSGLGPPAHGIVCAGRKVVKQSGNWETEMNRLSESGAIAGSKELWTCRAAVAPLGTDRPAAARWARVPFPGPGFSRRTGPARLLLPLPAPVLPVAAAPPA